MEMVAISGARYRMNGHRKEVARAFPESDKARERGNKRFDERAFRNRLNSARRKGRAMSLIFYILRGSRITRRHKAHHASCLSQLRVDAPVAENQVRDHITVPRERPTIYCSCLLYCPNTALSPPWIPFFTFFAFSPVQCEVQVLRIHGDEGKLRGFI